MNRITQGPSLLVFPIAVLLAFSGCSTNRPSSDVPANSQSVANDQTPQTTKPMESTTSASSNTPVQEGSALSVGLGVTPARARRWNSNIPIAGRGKRFGQEHEMPTFEKLAKALIAVPKVR